MVDASSLDAPHSDGPQTLSHRQILVVFSGLILAVMLAALDSTIVTTALPTIVGELGGLEQLSWVVTAYLVGQTIVTPIYGKLGDLYGRKGVLQGAILLFLIGSMLCGASQSMSQLIFFRWVQGLGGGGLMATTQAVVGDIVPPLQRGRYQGIFGAVFGVASVAGPLIGGYFTTYWTWRWIFYINLPLGLVAMLVLAKTLPSVSRKVSHQIDYAGALLIALTLTSVILMADLGGTVYSWDSPLVIGLGVTACLCLGLFIWVESRAMEPIMPLGLFLNRTFTVSVFLSMIVGFSLWGSVTYLPVFLQVVKGSSPTESGMQLLPLMGGVLTMSIISGQVISRTGRYKIFPVTGMFIMTIALWLLTGMDETIRLSVASLYFLLLGLGLGMVMQVLMIAIQNAVEYRSMGVATSGALLFRLMGGSLGTAILGVVFALSLHHHLIDLLPAGAADGAEFSHLTPQWLLKLPSEERGPYMTAFASSFRNVFSVAAVFAAGGFVLAWFLPELALQKSFSRKSHSADGKQTPIDVVE